MENRNSNDDYKYYVVIDRFFTGDHRHGHAYTVWAKCHWFSGLVSYPVEEAKRFINYDDTENRIFHRFVEFENPDWSSTIESPCNNDGMRLFAPVNYDRIGHTIADTSDDGKYIDNRDPND